MRTACGPTSSPGPAETSSTSTFSSSRLGHHQQVRWHQIPPRFRANFTPSSRRVKFDDGTSTAYRTGPWSTKFRSAKSPRHGRPNAGALESTVAPSARLRRDHHAATGPVLLPAPPGRERPTPLAPRRRRHSFVSRRRGARLAWRPQLALADLEPTALRTRPSVKLAARPGLRRVASGAVNARCWQGRLR